MKISFDSLNINHNVDRVTTSQSSTTTQGLSQNGAYAIDISGTVMDNSAYKGNGITTEEVMLNAEQGMISAQQDYMTVMSNFMSAEDYAKLEENGFKPENLDAETFVTVLDEIKVKLAEAGIEIEGYNDDLDAEEVAKITGSDTRGRQIVDQLHKNDIPVSKENVLEAGTTLEKSSQLTTLSDGAKKYLIQNQSELSLKNVYKAQFSTNTERTRQSRGYYEEETPGYYAKKADDFNWDHIKGQMQSVIQDAQLEVNETTMQEAKWLVENGIPLTEASLNQLHEINQIQLPLDEEAMLTSVTNAMLSGKKAEQASLTNTQSIYDKANAIYQEVNDITDQAVKRVVDADEPLTIQNLVQADQELDHAGPFDKNGTVSTENADSSQSDMKSTALITARRQLEEIRLQMTVEANVKLLKSDYAIDTTPIEQVIEELKAQEQSRREILFQTKDAGELTTREDLYHETLTKVNDLPAFPAQLIGKVAANSAFFTINYAHLQGTVLKAKYDEAGEAYETFMTSPRADLGDSIKKAFRNVDDILDDMSLEKNEINRRTVRILGYNNMYITEDNINTVKNADLKLQSVVRKLTPANTLQLIRDGMNPLNMNLEALDQYLTQNMTQDSGTEKYSEYLYKLEKNHTITEEEKESYIGVYRLLRQIDKSDDSVIGSLLQQGSELSFKNLLTAVRNKHNGNREYTIDDAFGGISAKDNSSSISSQIESYYNSLVHELQQNASPEKLAKVNIQDNMTLESLYESMMSQNESETSYSETDVMYQQEKQKEIQSIRYVNETTLQSILDFNQPVTVDNLLAMDYLKQCRGSTFKQLFQHAAEVSDQAEEQLEDAMYKLQRNMTDSTSANTAYENLVDVSKDILENMTLESGSYIDVKSISNFHKQLNIASNLAKKESYEVPVQINGEKLSINLQILHSTDDIGSVQVTFNNDYYGSVYASFEAYTDENNTVKVKGMIASTDEQGTERLKGIEKLLSNEISNDHCEVEGIYYTCSKSLEINHIHHAETDTEIEKGVNTNTLYDISKAFLIAIQSQKETTYED